MKGILSFDARDPVSFSMKARNGMSKEELTSQHSEADKILNIPVLYFGIVLTRSVYSLLNIFKPDVVLVGRHRPIQTGHSLP